MSSRYMIHYFQKMSLKFLFHICPTLQIRNKHDEVLLLLHGLCLLIHDKTSCIIYWIFDQQCSMHNPRMQILGLSCLKFQHTQAPWDSIFANPYTPNTLHDSNWNPQNFMLCYDNIWFCSREKYQLVLFVSYCFFIQHAWQILYIPSLPTATPHQTFDIVLLIRCAQDHIKRKKRYLR